MKKFKIPSIPPTTNKTIRFPNDLISEIEKSITGKNCTFSAFVIESVRVALDDITENKKEEERLKESERLAEEDRILAEKEEKKKAVYFFHNDNFLE